MKFTIAAVLLAQVVPSIAGGLFMNTPLADIETCDPSSSDVHIGRSSCDSGYECFPNEDFGLGGICITRAAARELRAALLEDRFLQPNDMDSNSTDAPSVAPTVPSTTASPVATPPTAPPTASAAMLSTGVVVSMIGFVAAVVLN
jgi:hypothetical protein